MRQFCNLTVFPKGGVKSHDGNFFQYFINAYIPMRV